MGNSNSEKMIIKNKIVKFDSSILYFNYLKFLIIGDSKTGKTNLINYFKTHTKIKSIIKIYN